ncbi:hypothetical protein SMB554_00220 [Sinorhizobium meliloti]|nr:hypothetical protein SMB554_00220 [Sinorhizobium meliloti]ATB00469.1 hypothetical protein BWO76_13945 [Sinorhizobium meliloti]ATB06477.1 hypothetical protein BWO90_14015 [Sinorhizobium meliloti]
MRPFPRCPTPAGAAAQALQRRASYQTRKGHCSTLICCMFLSFNRIRLKETCSSGMRKTVCGFPPASR